ncbi:3-isopropylmalate dehydrogenase [Patescibacteria group bacterium]
MKKKIAVLAGDGIGPEVMKEAVKVLNKVTEVFGHEFETVEALIGGAAWDEHKDHFPESTKRICEESDALLFGSVGGPIDLQMEEKWKDCEKKSILGLREYFKFNVNLRPAKVYPGLESFCVLRSDIVAKGIDIMCVREIIGGIYFSEHKTKKVKGKRIATDLMKYDEDQIASVARKAFECAMKRGKLVHSIDKANVLDCSRLWRDVVTKVSKDFPECELRHMLVDNCCAQLVRSPYEFDVILAPNMFGDIISDEASVFAGSLGMLPSASISEDGFAMYEPIGGSAPDIEGKGIANPIAQILSVAMMLKYSFNMLMERDAIINAVETVLSKGYRTADIAGDLESVSTSEMGDLIVKFFSEF